MIDVPDAEAPAPVPLQRIHVNRFYGSGTQVVAVLAAPASRLADLHEVGGPQAGPVMVRIDKGLHKPWAVAVLSLEIPRQATQDPPQNMTGQMDATHRRADQEAAHAHDPVARRVALFGTPRDPAVACPEMECARGKPDGAEPARLRLHEVAHLAAGKGGQAARMLIGHQGVPDAAMRPVTDHPHGQAPQLPEVLRHRPGQGYGPVDPDRSRRDRRPLRRRQNDPVATRRNDVQRFQASRQLRPAPGVGKAEFLTDPAPHGSPGGELLSSENLGNAVDRSRIVERAQDL